MSFLTRSTHPKAIVSSPVDGRLKRLRDTILPESPYILTVPSTYHLGSQHINDWRRGTPFAANEQQLQYLSFLPHTMDDTMLKAEGDWDDGNGGVADKSSQAASTRRSSGTISPMAGQSSRKKMTLNDYKKKVGQAGMKLSPSGNAMPKPHEKPSSIAVSVEKEVLPAKDGSSQGQKRPIEAISQDNNPKSLHDPVPPPVKKARNSPDPLVILPSETPKIEKPNAHGFPPLLSPTLPPSIEEELARLQANIKSATDSKVGQKRTSEASNAPPSKKQPLTQVSALRAAKVSQTTSGDAVASLNSSVAKSSVTKRPNASPSSRSLDTTLHQPATPLTAPKDKGQKVNGAASTIGLPNGSSKNLKTTSSTTAGTKGSPEDLETKSLVVVLKIPKSVRKNWAGLIRFAPRPKKLNVERSAEKVREKPLVNGSEKPKENLPQPRANLQPNKQDTSRTGEKRRRPVFKEEPEPSNKRQKPYAGTGVAHKPHTPARPIKSPAVSQPGSAQRPQNSTPKRDLKSVAMRRITSQDVEVKTPSGGTRGGTPAASGSAERGNRDGRSISNPSAASLTNDKGEEVALWRAEQNRFLGLGKALKHEADSILKPKEDMAIDPIAKNQGTAIAIETILCYILGFTAGDEAARANRKAGDASGWRSLLAYIHFVKAIACATPHLSGLVLQLEAICRDIVHAYDLERLERDPLPYSSDEAQPPAAAGTESNPVAARDSTDKASSNRREYVDFKSKLIENARLAQQSWLAGTSRLSIDELSQSYPKTWAKRAKAPAAANGREKLVAKNYSSGGFYLPLSSTSSGIEAVRMGWSFLKEWTAKEGVKWEGKLGL